MSADALAYFDEEGKRHVTPYPHTYATSAKGRWMGMTLLEAFAREFAVVGDELDDDTSSSGPTASASPAAPTNITIPATAAAPSVCTDFVQNSLTYAKKMAAGNLFIVGREEECKRAGAASVLVIEGLLAGMSATATTGEGSSSAQPSRDEWFAKLPKQAVLKQLNAIRHVVTRREHFVDFGSQCIEVVTVSRDDGRGKGGGGGEVVVTDDAATAALDTPQGPPYYLAINKPSSVAIHPGGRYHSNTLLRLIEDTLSGDGVAQQGHGKGGGAGRGGGGAAVKPLQRTFAVVDGYRVVGASSCGSGSTVATPRRVDDAMSTFICEPVVMVPSDGTPATTNTFVWHPLIRLPHDKLSEADRAWLLGHLATGSVVRTANGNVNTADERCNRIIGVSDDWMDCAHVPERARKAGEGVNANSTASTVKQPALKLHIVHRLDRCTSGIIVFALDTDSARGITESFADKGDGEAVAGAAPSSPPTAADNNDATNATTSISDDRHTTYKVLTQQQQALPKRHKQYLARVVGDIRCLFRSAIGADAKATSTAATASNTDAADDEEHLLNTTPILIDSASYCASFQGALYWCLGAEEQRLFASTAKATGAAPLSPAAGDKRPRDEEGKDGKKQQYSSIEEKREAMRLSVVSKRRIETTTRGDVGRTSTTTGDDPTANAAEGTANDTTTATSDPLSRYDGLKHARTCVRFRYHDAEANESVVECNPLTGRTHQIRIHLASHGFPIVGDVKYHAKGLQCYEQYGWGRGATGFPTSAPSKEEAASAEAPLAVDPPTAPAANGGGSNTFIEDAPAICLHAFQYTISGEGNGAALHVLRTHVPLWAVPKV